MVPETYAGEGVNKRTALGNDRRRTFKASLELGASWPQEGKANGVGDARNRVKLAVARTVPFGFLCQTLTIICYQLYGDAEHDVRTRSRIAPWYPHKQTVSYNDMLAALRRELIRVEFHSQAPRRTLSPQITHSPPSHGRSPLIAPC